MPPQKFAPLTYGEKSTLLSDGALCFANDTRTRARMLDHWQRRIKVHVV